MPISRSDTARWRSRISSSSVFAFLTMDATRLHSISARSSRACIRAVWARHATRASFLASPCLKALRDGDTLVVWKLDRLGRDLHHLVNTVHDLTARGVGLKVLTGQGAAIDTTTPAGKLVFGIFAALAEFERELISERTTAGVASARARGRKGGRPYKMTPAKLRLAAASMGQPDTKISELCTELGITRQRSTATSRQQASSGRTG